LEHENTLSYSRAVIFPEASTGHHHTTQKIAEKDPSSPQTNYEIERYSHAVIINIYYRTFLIHLSANPIANRSEKIQQTSIEKEYGM
jgi:hypothetical protein